MANFFVVWEIKLHAGTPLEAAQEALKIQRDPESLAVMFNVISEDGSHHFVDLLDLEEEV